MSELNRPDNYAGRVAYAAQVIERGGPLSRSFSNCFENDDGDVVAAALMRRATKNLTLAANLPRYLDISFAKASYLRLRGKNLSRIAELARASVHSIPVSASQACANG